MTAPWTARRALPATARRCIAAALLPTAAVAAAAAAGAHLLPPRVDDPAGAAAAATTWLSLPLATIAICCCIAAVRFWPAFAARRPGADWVLRLQRGPLRGCGGALAGALLAQFALGALCLAALAPWFGAPADASARHPLATPADALALPGAPPLDLAGPDGPCTALELRPLAALPRGELRPTHLEVLADGERLTTADIVFVDTNRLLRIEFAPRPVHRLGVRATDGTVPLWFPPGSLVLVEAAAHGTPTNALAAAAVALVPSFLALAVAACCAVAAALPVVIAVVAALLFASLLGGIGPFDVALRALLTGVWIPGAGVFPQCLPSLAVGCASMILAMLLRRSRRT